jgi:hypothetical protein
VARFYFNVTNGRPYTDTDGLELPNLAAARAEAVGFAQDLMRREPARREWSSWAIRVTDEARRVVLDLAFSEAV